MSGQKDAASGSVPSGVFEGQEALAPLANKTSGTASTGSTAATSGGDKAATGANNTKRGPTLSEMASKLNIGSASADGNIAGGNAQDGSGAEIERGSRGRLGLAGRLATGDGATDGSTDNTVESLDEKAAGGSKAAQKADGNNTNLPSLEDIRERLSRKGLTHSKSKAQIASASSSSDAGSATDASQKVPADTTGSTDAEKKAMPADERAKPVPSVVEPAPSSASTDRTQVAQAPSSTRATPSSSATATPTQSSGQTLRAAPPSASGGLSSAKSAIGPDGKKVHPLQHKWTLYFDSKTWNPSAAAAGTGSQASTPATTPQIGSASASSGAASDKVPYPTGIAQSPAPTSSTGATAAVGGESKPAATVSMPSLPEGVTPQAPQTWEAALKMLGAYNTVESFFGTFSTLRRPSQLEKGSNYHLFKDGIKPMWEDRRNAQGGKWMLTLKGGNPALLDRSWMYLVLALIGEELDPDDVLTGAVVSVRQKGDRISIWTRTKDDTKKLNALAKRFISILDVEKEPGVGLEFATNTGAALPQPNGFWNFYNPPVSSSASASGGTPGGRQHAFGGFGPSAGSGSSPAMGAGHPMPYGSSPHMAGFTSPPPPQQQQGYVPRGAGFSPSAPGRFGAPSAGTAFGGSPAPGAVGAPAANVLRRGTSENPFARNPKIVAPGGESSDVFGSSPSKFGDRSGLGGRSNSTAGLVPPGFNEPRAVLGSASPIKRGGPLPSLP